MRELFALLLAVSSAVVLVGCGPGEPSMAEVERLITAHVLQADIDQQALALENFEKVDGYRDSDTTRVIEVSYDIVFKTGVDEMFAAAQERRQIRPMESWGLMKYATKLQAEFGMRKRGDRVPVMLEYRFRKSDNGWRLAPFE